jgi:hypothetical protein
MTDDERIALIAVDDPAMAAQLRAEQDEQDSFYRNLDLAGTPAYRNTIGESDEQICDRLNREYPGMDATPPWIKGEDEKRAWLAGRTKI